MDVLIKGFLFLGLVLGCAIATYIVGAGLYFFNIKGKDKGDEQDFMVEDSFRIEDAQKNVVVLYNYER